MSFSKLFHYEVGNQPTIAISHMVPARENFNRGYGYTMIRLQRPSEGWAKHSIACESCGEPIEVDLADVRTTKVRLWRWRLWFVACIAAIVLSFVLTVTRTWGVGFAVTGMLLSCTIVPFAALAFFGTLDSEDGVKMTARAHELKYPEGRPPGR